MPTRREFLGALSVPASAAVLCRLAPSPRAHAAAILEDVAPPSGTPEAVAEDEDFWSAIGRAFTVDRSLVNLNSGGVSPAPRVVQQAMKRHLDYSNAAPPYTMWRILEPRRESVRSRLAKLMGCDREEIAITRNASEGLQICQFGIDLARGDEVLTTNQDYPRMLSTFRQRARREGIRLVEISLPVPAEDPREVVKRFEARLTERTRLILVCHVINLTGQIMPVADIVAMARRRGVPVIVDGAHAFAHLVFEASDLDCDFYATSLHKWLFAPHGTGLLYVRRERIADVWPLMAAPEGLDDDIRKFEEIGTHPAANHLAIAEAITFHEAIGPARKAARLRRLRDVWTRRLLEHDRVRLHTSLEPGFAGGIATFEVDGIDPRRLNGWLWAKRRILTTAIEHPEFRGIRVSPSVFTTPQELDRFVEAVEHAIGEGLPDD